jgi:WD40 repeat protein
VRRADEGSASSPEVAVDALIAGRLVTVTADRWEISHDALLEGWPRLRHWLEERVSESERLDHLAASAQAWNVAGRPAGDLYRGVRLHAALEWRRQHPDDVTGQESAFLDASERADRSELAVAQRRVVAERRGRHRLRWVAGGLAATLVVALVGALLAVTARSAATRSAHRARSEAVTADARRLAAESLSAPDLATSALLAAAAFRLQDSPDSRGAMLSALERGQSALFRVATPRRLAGLLASVDGTRLYALQNDRTVDVIDTARRRIVSSYPALATDAVGVTGRSLVVVGNVPGRFPTGFGRLTVRDTATGATVRVLSETTMDGPGVPSMAPGGRWLVADRATDRTARHPTRFLDVYDARDWRRAARTIELPAPVAEIAAGSRVAAVSTSDRHVYLIDLATLRILRSAHRRDLPDQEAASANVPFVLSPDGHALAFAHDTGTSAPVLVKTDDLAGAATTLPRTGSAAAVVRFDPGGTELAVGFENGALNLYRVADGEPGVTLAGESGSIRGIAWGTEGGPTAGATPALFTAGLDSQVVSWSVTSTPRLLHLHGPVVPTADFAVQAGAKVYGVYPPQGEGPETQERMFTLDLGTGTMRSWPLGVGADDYITQVAGTPDGARAIVSVDGAHSNRWQIWDLRRGVILRTVPAPPGADNSLGLSAAISADGATAVVGIDATRLGVLDLASGRFRRTIRVHFAGAAGARAHAVPWQFTPDGRVLLWGYDPGPRASARGAGPDQQLGLVDVARGALVAQAAVGDIDGPKFFGWSHNGASMVMGTYAGSLSTFAAATLRPMATAATVDTGVVLSASFSPDDQTIVAAGTDATMTFWTAATLSREGGREIAPNASASWWYAWFTPTGEVTGLAPQVAQPTADGERLFTFPARPTEWLALTCGLAGQDLTRAQWAQYAGDQPYRHVC